MGSGVQKINNFGLEEQQYQSKKEERGADQSFGSRSNPTTANGGGGRSVVSAAQKSNSLGRRDING